MPEPIMDATEGVEEWLANFLERLSDLHTITQGRVFPIFVPSLEELPAVVYRRTGTTRDRHMQGASGEATARFVVAAMAMPNREGYRKTVHMGRAIRLGIDGMKGSDREKGHYIRRIFVEDESDDPGGAIPVDGDMQPVHMRVLSVTLTYVEQKRNLSGGS